MDKLYNISKTAEILDVTPKTLRIWDKENKLKPVLTSGGHRRYRESDINKIIGNDKSDIEKLLEFAQDAKVTILKNDCYKNGLDKTPVLIYQMILSWDINKIVTDDVKPYDSFIEVWGNTINECVNQLKEDITKIKC